VTLTQEFETSTNSPDDMYLRVEVFMGPCQRCGRCFPPPTPLERMMHPGFRNGGSEHGGNGHGGNGGRA
jgi:hypothetical protein